MKIKKQKLYSKKSLQQLKNLDFTKKLLIFERERQIEQIREAKINHLFFRDDLKIY